MSIKNGKVNPLNVLGERKCDFPAHHFHYRTINKYTPAFINLLDRWIYENLNGRYYIGQGINLVDNSIVYTTQLGFENEKELSFFSLACPLLN
jgi:hypothetical protein